MVNLVEGEFQGERDPHELALSLVWHEFSIDRASSPNDIQGYLSSLRANPGNYQDIFDLYRTGGIYSEGNIPPGLKRL